MSKISMLIEAEIDNPGVLRIAADRIADNLLTLPGWRTLNVTITELQPGEPTWIRMDILGDDREWRMNPHTGQRQWRRPTDDETTWEWQDAEQD